eukprot:CAMPEP_0181327230 /NCGR_PEP_ID=MMETSP1101-20121128/21974_1 /TAXON_ID=46948 /ORGANISM="Rhodomonas abbreviata, Strain Caron Lab Isolate" /LENGTH=312 /DNA_ID=CAMNT_0023435843 /DNA_START=279 /DNA_END=1213 /DNA_ORIENTATION=+
MRVLRDNVRAVSKQLGYKVDVVVLENGAGIFMGKVVLNQPQGHGLLIYSGDDSEGRTEFRGEFVCGARHGYGTLTWADGSRYEGDWQNDKPCGLGVEVFNDQSRYEGKFVNDQRHGLGQYTSAKGTLFKGKWEVGQLHGLVTSMKTDDEDFAVSHYARGKRDDGEWGDHTATEQEHEQAAKLAQQVDLSRDKARAASVKAGEIWERLSLLEPSVCLLFSHRDEIASMPSNAMQQLINSPSTKNLLSEPLAPRTREFRPLPSVCPEESLQHEAPPYRAPSSGPSQPEPSQPPSESSQPPDASSEQPPPATNPS